MRSNVNDRLALALFLLAVAGAIFAYGVAVGHYRIFPYGQLKALVGSAHKAVETQRPGVFYRAMRDSTRADIYDPERAQPGLNLVARTDQTKSAWIEITTMEGEVIHRWAVDWTTLWPDHPHVPEDQRPKFGSNRYAHGVVLLPGGDIAFNMEDLGLIRVDPEGRPVWRLPYQTHHSLEIGPEGNLWASGRRRVTEPNPSFPDRSPPFDEYTILKVSPDGQILLELSVPEILRENGYGALVHAARRSAIPSSVKDDRLHLNDVDPFPDTLEPGFFRPGHVAVSLRDVNTVFVLDVASREIVFLTTGRFSAQHDADFVSGSALSVFDNQGVGEQSSRIVTIEAPEDTMRIAYESEPGDFFTGIMGNHQWLPNGNLLITESLAGRAFEVTPEGDIVWQHINRVEPGVVGTITEVIRLSPEAADRLPSAAVR